MLFPFEFCYTCIHFSDFIMPLCILLFSCQFYYSLSNYVMQFSNSTIIFYSVLFHCTVLSCTFESYYFLSNSVIPILLCQYEFSYSASNSIISFRIMFFQILDGTVPWRPVESFFPWYSETWQTWTSTFSTESITSMHICNSTAPLFTKFWPW